MSSDEAGDASCAGAGAYSVRGIDRGNVREKKCGDIGDVGSGLRMRTCFFVLPAGDDPRTILYLVSKSQKVRIEYGLELWMTRGCGVCAVSWELEGVGVRSLGVIEGLESSCLGARRNGLPDDMAKVFRGSPLSRALVKSVHVAAHAYAGSRSLELRLRQSAYLRRLADTFGGLYVSR